jgi:CheY-like chemotaxis protein
MVSAWSTSQACTDPWLGPYAVPQGLPATKIRGSSWPPATGSQGERSKAMGSTLAAPPVASPRSQPADAILLAEDDPDIAEMYRFKLEYDGFRVHLAMTGETALTLAFESRPALVLLDMGLPGMDGLQVLAALRADHRTFSLPVVILSNYDDPDVIQRGLQLGAIDYLIKTHITPAGVSGGIARWMAAQPACITRAVS